MKEKILSVRKFLTIGSYENDDGFRELLSNLARRGLLIAGCLGAFAIIIYVAAYVFLVHKTAVWSYANVNPKSNIVLLDKTLIFVLSLSSILFSRFSLSLFWSRLLVLFIVWILSLAMLLDDIMAHDISIAPEYIGLVLILATGTVPYTGWQTAFLSVSVIITSVIAAYLAPELIGIPSVQKELAQLIYLCLLAILLTGISSQLYLYRYDQYRARSHAEELGRQLEERALLLEKMKDKSDKQARELQKNEKLKNRFFANISHEFRTPLTLILGPLHDIMDDSNPGQVEQKSISTDMLKMMHKNGSRLLELINQLLDLSKIDAGNIKMKKQRIDTIELVPEIVLGFVPLAESRQVNLTWEVEEHPMPIWADPQQMERAIGNLLSNAIKFTPFHGTVSVTVIEDDTAARAIQITVADTGIGIPGEDMPYIFDRYYQAAQPEEMFNSGTGIGLALVKEIVDLHEGNIRVDSSPGEGTTFTIEFFKASGRYDIKPRNEDSVIRKWTSEAESGIHDSGDDWEVFSKDEAPSVLLIDDNPDMLDYIKLHLSRRYRVITETQSRHALEVIKDHTFDLVISDVMMPHPDGFELCRTIKDHSELNHIPVILLTAQAEEGSRIEGLESHADDYIAKPFNAAELMVRVENLIGLRRILRDKYSAQVRLKGKKIDVTSEDARFLQQVQSVIEKHMGNSNFGVNWLADEVNLSSRQLQRKLHSITDLSAGGYIRMLRLERASQLLSRQWGHISEIAYKVGFQDPKYFSQLFKQTFGVNPSEYRADEEQ